MHVKYLRCVLTEFLSLWSLTDRATKDYRPQKNSLMSEWVSESSWKYILLVTNAKSLRVSMPFAAEHW